MTGKCRRILLAGALLCSTCALGAPKAHVISFGKWTAAKWQAGLDGKALDIKIRGLFVDTRLREYTTGMPHEVTDRLFVVRRMFRLNDALPEAGSVPRWVWERGGWLLVDRLTGRITQINLPDFDPFYSTASWYRDYAAYCGVSEDGKKAFAVVVQLGRRKPILKKLLGEPFGEDAPDSECPAPSWQRGPTRVVFAPEENQKLVYSVRGHAVDMISEADAVEDEGTE